MQQAVVTYNNSKPHKFFQLQNPNTYGEMLFVTLAPAWLPGDKTFGWNYLCDHAPYWLTLIRQAIPGCWGEYIRSNRDDDPATRRHKLSAAHIHGVIYTPPGSSKVDCAALEALEARLERAMHPEIPRSDGCKKAYVQVVKNPLGVLRYLAQHNILRDHNKGRRRRDKFGEWPPEPICEKKEKKKNIFMWKPILIRDSEMFEFLRAKMPFGTNKLQAFLSGIAYYKSFCPCPENSKNKNIKVFGRALGRRHRAHAGVVGGLAPLRQTRLTYRRAVNFALFINHFRRWLWPLPRGPGPPSRLAVLLFDKTLARKSSPTVSVEAKIVPLWVASAWRSARRQGRKGSAPLRPLALLSLMWGGGCVLVRPHAGLFFGTSGV